MNTKQIAQSGLSLTIALLTSMSSASAFAAGPEAQPLRTLGPVVAQLKVVSPDVNLPSGSDLSGGYVRIDRQAQTITLTLTHAYRCPLHALCTKPMSQPVSLQFVLEAIQFRECGIRQFTGSLQDETTGVTRQVTVYDRSRDSDCASIGPIVPTSVTIRSTSTAADGTSAQSEAEFDGVALTPAQE